MKKHQQTAVLLQLLVDGLVGNSGPLAKNHGSQVVNEVGKGVFLQTLNYQLIELINEILQAVISNSRHGDIHITSERRNGKLVLSIEERNNYNGYALSFRIGSLVPDAAQLGGHLDIRSPQKLVTTISLAFPGKYAA